MKIRHFASAAVAAVALAGAAASAHASVFHGDAGIAILGAPTVSLTNDTISYSKVPVFAYGGSGDLTAAVGPGLINGTLSFLSTVGATETESVPSFLTLAGTSGAFTFDVSSVKTTAYSIAPGSDTLSFYILGNDVNTALGESGPTSLTLSLNKTGSSPWSSSATIDAPPSAVPEPATWALMIGGVAMMGGMLRMSRRQGWAMNPA